MQFKEPAIHAPFTVAVEKIKARKPKLVRFSKVIVLPVIVVGLLVLLIASVAMQSTYAADFVVPAQDEVVIHYFNNDNPSDTIDRDNFGPDRYVESVNATGDASLDYIVDDLAFSRIPTTEDDGGSDPALAAAHVWYWSQFVSEWNEKNPGDMVELVLPDEIIKDLENGAERAHQLFLGNLETAGLPDDYDGLVGVEAWGEGLKQVMVWEDESKQNIAVIDVYQSQMYMLQDGNGVGVPKVVICKIDVVSGHEIVFLHPKFGTVKYRLECGYQPDTTRWWVPEEPGIPELEAKDPSLDPARQGNANTGGGVNDDSGAGAYEPEYNNPPEVYTPPAAPPAEVGGGTVSPPSGTHTGSEDPSGNNTQPGGDSAGSGSSDTSNSGGYNTPPTTPPGGGTVTDEEGFI